VEKFHRNSHDLEFVFQINSVEASKKLSRANVHVKSYRKLAKNGGWHEFHFNVQLVS